MDAAEVANAFVCLAPVAMHVVEAVGGVGARVVVAAGLHAVPDPARDVVVLDHAVARVHQEHADAGGLAPAVVFDPAVGDERVVAVLDIDAWGWFALGNRKAAGQNHVQSWCALQLRACQRVCHAGAAMSFRTPHLQPRPRTPQSASQ